MKITIDTKQDSRDEIRKVIRMLSDLLGSNESSNYGHTNYNSNQDNSNASETQPGFFNMFDSGSSTEQTEQNQEPETEEKKEDFEIYEY